MDRVCAICAAPFTAQSYRARYCSPRCRQRAHRGAQEVADVVPLPSPADRAGSITEAVTVTLKGISAMDTPLGQLALLLARRLDTPGLDSGSSVAATSRELMRVLRQVEADAKRTGPNPLSGIRRRGSLRVI